MYLSNSIHYFGAYDMYKLVSLTERSTKDLSRVAFRFSNDGLITVSGKRRSRHIYSLDIYNIGITRCIPLSGTQLQSEEVFSLIYMCYLYTLRLTDTKKIRRYLPDLDRDLITQTKDNVFCSDAIVRYKIATMRCIVRRLTPKKFSQIEYEFKQCGLNADDSILYHMLYLNNDISDFIALMGTIEDRTFTLDVDTLAAEIHNDKLVHNEFIKTANYFGYRKSKFIADGNRFEVKDIIQDLIQRFVQSYYWVRPFYSKLHAINYAKRSMHGCNNNLIAYYTDPSRERLIKDPDNQYEYSNLLHTFDDEITMFGSANTIEEAMVGYLDLKKEFKEVA